VKTTKRIITLADYTLAGHRGNAFQEFRNIVAANGFTMSRGGWIKNSEGENVTRGWEAFAYMVSNTKEVVLHEVQAITELEDVEAAEAEEMAADALPANPFPYPTRGLLPEVDAILDRRRAEAAEAEEERLEAVEVTYLYSTRTPTLRLGDLSHVSVLIVEEATAVHEGECKSGASLACSGTGFLRILPESMLPNTERESMIQCTPCYEASADAYVRKLHRSQG
jgi:hypothetical protein